MTNDVQLLTTAEVARRLNVSVATVNRLARDGSLTPAAKGPGIRGPRLYAETDIAARTSERDS